MESRREKHAAPGRELEPVVLSPSADAIRASRETFCGHLVGAREKSGKSLDEIASVTRIPMRSLERIEAGEFEKLPADVFVRGFLRSYARCVDLDEEDTLRRYAECGMASAPVAAPLAGEAPSSGSDPVDGPAQRRTSRLSTLWSREASQAADPVPAHANGTSPREAEPRAGATARVPRAASVTEDSAGVKAQKAAKAPSSKKRKRKRRKRKPETTVVVVRATAPAIADMARAGEAATASSESASVDAAASLDAQALEATQAEAITPGDELSLSESVPEPGSDASADTAPARQPLPVPVLRIDDDHPEDAERIREERSSREREDVTWRHFLPPALLDSPEGSRRGALTLAVIILVIVATLTMSYLMRRPSDSGDGVTLRAPGATQADQRIALLDEPARPAS